MEPTLDPTRLVHSSPIAPQHAFATHPVDAAGLLVDAEDYYRAFYRAACMAEHSILLSGWQFDRNVALLRGKEAESAQHPVTLLKLLNTLCEQKPALKIHILAWDFHLILAAEREWMQRLMFNWMTNTRLQFRFDDNHVERGCHHQKFVVIDSEICFLGGIDLCDHRWDSRQHKAENPLRMSRGAPHQPFHDVQAYARGTQVAEALTALFRARWQSVGKEALPELGRATKPSTFTPDNLLPLPAKQVSLSRTDPNAQPWGDKPCLEIEKLYTAAIARAERLIYLETQYLSSHVIAEALLARMADKTRDKLEIVMILNKRGETLKEEAAVGLAQAQILMRLRQAASGTGHQLGLYITLPECDADRSPTHATFIHSKIMVVDDCFLTVGSANLTNRSMAVDTELNLTVEADGPDEPLALAIRDIRGALLAEHTGGPSILKVRGLVSQLDDLARWGAEGRRDIPCRLRPHPSPSPEEETMLAVIDPQQLPFDPDESDLPMEYDAD